MNHLINRLQFEVNCPDEEQAFRIRHNFAPLYQQQITEIVDRICSKYTRDDEWIRIDKFEIDLGEFSSTGFDAQFPEQLLNRFEKELIRKLALISPAQKQNSRSIAHSEMLRYFLLHGTLPWWADETFVSLDLISDEVIADPSPGFHEFLQRNITNLPVWQRIAFQLPRTAQEYIISLFRDLADAVHQLEDMVRVEYGKLSLEPVYDQLETRGIIVQIVLEQAVDIFKNPENRLTLSGIFSTLIGRLIPENTPGLQAEFIPPEIEPEANPVESKAESPVIYQSGTPEPSSPEKYYVKQAGIILLTPFLQSFYHELGLLDGMQWKDRQAQSRAVHILKYIGTDMTNQPEFTFVLEKLLCGAPVEEPIQRDIKLEEKEITEVQLLLESVIQHWTALKNTSMAGLRETFLKRDGIVTRRDNGWLVQVERKTWDVLLDRIPWGFSTIGLPWNDYVIYAEW
jgi:hypothetical protein